jgi:hypothetical protein
MSETPPYVQLYANAKSPPMLLHGAGFDRKQFLTGVLRRFTSDRESVALERIEHIAGNSGHALQIVPTLERTILGSMLYDFPGMLFADALNGREFGFGGSIQINVPRHTYSFFDETQIKPCQEEAIHRPG